MQSLTIQVLCIQSKSCQWNSSVAPMILRFRMILGVKSFGVLFGCSGWHFHTNRSLGFSEDSPLAKGMQLYAEFSRERHFGLKRDLLVEQTSTYEFVRRFSLLVTQRWLTWLNCIQTKTPKAVSAPPARAQKDHDLLVEIECSLAVEKQITTVRTILLKPSLIGL